MLLFLLACNSSVSISHAKLDADNDGYDASADCNDEAQSVHPEAPETCNSIDDDCDGEVDEDAADAATWYQDGDGDGHGDVTTATQACTAAGVASGDDCDDGNASIFPGASEICDGLDDDCDTQIDEDATDAIAWYPDEDDDGYGSGTPTFSCVGPAGTAVLDGDCDDANPAIHPDAEETDCTDPTDYNCDGEVVWADEDTDGWAACGDCVDTDPAVNPAATEVCNGADDDCDGLRDEEDDSLADATVYGRDFDGDGYAGSGVTVSACNTPTGYVAATGDCDDGDAGTNPGATEICDGRDVDEDCDGLADDADPTADPGTWLSWYRDSDGDGYGNASVLSCDPISSLYVANGGDCDDVDATIHPGASEICDNLDNDCDGLLDDDDPDLSGAPAWYRDADSDGHGDAAHAGSACAQPSGYVATGDDCDDGAASIHPAATEICNGADDNCDGAIDEGLSQTWYADADGDGYGSSSSTTSACAQPANYVASSSDCNDGAPTINPGAAETCNGADDDCDGAVDDGLLLIWYADADGDGYGDSNTAISACTKPSGYVSVGKDCDESNVAVNPGATEVCDAADLDEDCDGLTDDQDPSVTGQKTAYPDKDGDGQGDTLAVMSCDATGLSSGTDCDDSDATIYKGAPETCDSVDQDCDGSSTDGCASRTLLGTYDSGDADTILYGAANFTFFGGSVASGDWNGDGLIDLAIGAPDDQYASAYAGYGVVYLYNGVLPTGTEIDTQSDVARIYSTALSNSDVGLRMWAIPDMDADGKDEFATSHSYSTQSMGMYRGGSLSGDIVYTSYYNRSYCMDMSGGGNIYTGRTTLACGYGAANSNAGAIYIYGDNSSVALATLTGEKANDYAGSQVEAEHDIDGDGFSDLIAGVARHSSVGTNSGQVYVVYGPVSGSTALSAADLKITAERAADGLGSQITAADMDNDGVDDLIASAPSWDCNSYGSCGKVYLFTSASTGTVAASTADYTIKGPGFGASLGSSALSSGDVDGDGAADLLVGAPQDHSGNGSAFLLYGPMVASADLAVSYDVWFYSGSYQESVGEDARILGDTNGDGYDDIAIGAIDADLNFTDNGTAWIFLGG